MSAILYSDGLIILAKDDSGRILGGVLWAHVRVDWHVGGDVAAAVMCVLVVAHYR